MSLFSRSKLALLECKMQVKLKTCQTRDAIQPLDHQLFPHYSEMLMLNLRAQLAKLGRAS